MTDTTTQTPDEFEAVRRLFGPERCTRCGEALTPWTLQKRDGGYASQQCKCDHPWSRKE